MNEPSWAQLVDEAIPKDYRRVGEGLVHRTAILFGDIQIGKNSRIDAYAVLTGPVVLGRYVHVGTGCFVSGANSLVRLDDFSSLSAGVKVFSGSDDYSGLSMTNPTVPMQCKPGLKRGPVIVGRHAIVGAGSVVLPSVQIGEGTAVAALAMVKESLEPWSIYGGVPARKLGPRKMDLLQYESLCA